MIDHKDFFDTIKKQFRESYNRWREHLRASLEEAVRQGELPRAIAIEEEIDLIVAATDGLLVGISLQPERFPKARQQQMINLIVARIGAVERTGTA